MLTRKRKKGWILQVDRNISSTHFVANGNKEAVSVTPSFWEFPDFCRDFLGQSVQFFLCSPFGDWIPGSRPSLMINVKILISKTASAPYRQDHLGFLWPTEAAVKSPLLLTSNMSKHVKFHFCGIFFIGCDLRWVGALECWRASQDVSIPD